MMPRTANSRRSDAPSSEMLAIRAVALVHKGRVAIAGFALISGLLVVDRSAFPVALRNSLGSEAGPQHCRGKQDGETERGDNLMRERPAPSRAK